MGGLDLGTLDLSDFEINFNPEEFLSKLDLGTLQIPEFGFDAFDNPLGLPQFPGFPSKTTIATGGLRTLEAVATASAATSLLNRIPFSGAALRFATGGILGKLPSIGTKPFRFLAPLEVGATIFETLTDISIPVFGYGELLPSDEERLALRVASGAGQ